MTLTLELPDDIAQALGGQREAVGVEQTPNAGRVEWLLQNTPLRYLSDTLASLNEGKAFVR